MKKISIIEITADELSELLKQAVVEVLQSELLNTINSPPKPSLEILTSKEVCSLLQISLPTLLNLRKTGKLKAKKIGGKIFYKKTEIEKLL